MDSVLDSRHDTSMTKADFPTYDAKQFTAWSLKTNLHQVRIGLILSLIMLLAFAIPDRLLDITSSDLSWSRAMLSPSLSLLFVWSYKVSNAGLFYLVLSAVYATFACALLLYTSGADFQQALYGLAGVICTICVLQVTITPPVMISAPSILVTTIVALLLFKTDDTLIYLLLLTTFLSLVFILLAAAYLYDKERHKQLVSEKKVEQQIKNLRSSNRLSRQILKHEIGNQLVALSSSLARLVKFPEIASSVGFLRERTEALTEFVDNISAAHAREPIAPEQTLKLSSQRPITELLNRHWEHLGFEIIKRSNVTRGKLLEATPQNDLAVEFLKQLITKITESNSWYTKVKLVLEQEVATYELLSEDNSSFDYISMIRTELSSFRYNYAKTTLQEEGVTLKGEVNETIFSLTLTSR